MIRTLATMALTGALLSACGDEDYDATALYEELQAANYQKNWSRPAKYNKLTALSKNSNHGDQGIIYYNDVVSDALQTSGFTKWPAGSIFVIDGYLEGKLNQTAVMEKRPSGWFFAAYDAEGYTKMSGEDAENLCTQCHGMYEENDYITSVPLP